MFFRIAEIQLTGAAEAYFAQTADVSVSHSSGCISGDLCGETGDAGAGIFCGAGTFDLGNSAHLPFPIQKGIQTGGKQSVHAPRYQFYHIDATE